MMSRATGSQIQRALLLVKLELQVLEELPHIPKHYTLLLPGSSPLRTKIAEMLLGKGCFHLASSIVDQFHLPLVQLGVNSLLELARRQDELQLQGNGMAIQSRFQPLVQFLHDELEIESFRFVADNLIDLWEGQLPGHPNEAENRRRIELLKSFLK